MDAVAKKPEANSADPIRSARVLIFGLVAVIILLGAVLRVQVISRAVAPPAQEARVDALANSSDECVVCHRRSTPGIVEQFGHSTMAAAEVTCRDCRSEEHTSELQSPTNL